MSIKNRSAEGLAISLLVGALIGQVTFPIAGPILARWLGVKQNDTEMVDESATNDTDNRAE